MKLVNVQAIKDELERLIRDYRFHSSAEAKYRCEAYKELSEWLDGLDVKDDMDTIHPIEDVVSNDPIANSYKEKYEQALKVAKETYNTQPMYREWLEKMYPELAESEDEKVRKCLIDFFEDWRENRSHCWGIAVSKILAWLENIPVTIDHEKREGFHLGYKACHEKQGEKSVKWNENTDGNKPQKHHSVLMKTTHGIAEGEWQGEKWFQYRWSGRLKDSDVLFWIELSDIEKQGEQKPTDEEMKTLLRSEYEKGRADAIAEMQKEWSEEEEKMFKSLKTLLNDASCYSCTEGVDKILSWLKSIKGRVQTKQEWNEEDKDYYDAIIAKLEVTQEDAALTNNQMNFLKSLRPQNRWKPSDEQMVLLSEVQNALLGKDCHNRFTNFMWELKKLKEGKV